MVQILFTSNRKQLASTLSENADGSLVGCRILGPGLLANDLVWSANGKVFADQEGK